MIPLIEDLPYILNCDKIVESNLSDKFVEYQRVFLAKSDLALNYGMVVSTLALKIALTWQLATASGYKQTASELLLRKKIFCSVARKHCRNFQLNWLEQK